MNLSYVKGRLNLGPDGLSRLPLNETETITKSNEYLNFAQEAIPVNWSKVRVETAHDRILSKISLYIKYGWPNKLADEFKAFNCRKNELYIENGVNTIHRIQSADVNKPNCVITA